MLLEHWIPFRLMLYSQSKFHLGNRSQIMLKWYSNNVFSDTDNEAPVGSREPQDKIPYRPDLSLVQKNDFEEKIYHFTEN